MKKVRFFMSAVAVVVAIGSAVAGSFFTPIHGYLFIDNPFPTADQCLDQGEICDTAGSVACTVKVNGVDVQLRPNNVVASSCGTPNLKRIP